jgi:menaquinone-dependent protoporphyrinogen oxidase
MKVLIIYATVEGQTEKVSRFVVDDIKKQGHEAVLINVEDTSDFSFDRVDAVILAASVHQRRHPRKFEAFLQAYQTELKKMQTLLLSVSLNAAFPEGLEEAGEYVVEMKMRTGLETSRELLVAGAIRTDQYDYFAMQVVRHVVLRGQDFDHRSGEHEFTDWDAVSLEVSEFLAGTS